MNFFIRELFDPSEPESEGQRVQGLVFELVVAARAVYDAWGWTRIIPGQTEILKPTGIGRYIDVSFMLGSPIVSQLNAIFCALMLLLGLTRRFRGAYALALFSFALQYSARFGLGKAQHSTSMMGMALLALAVSHLAYERADLRRKAAIGLTVALFSVGYLFAAGSKLWTTGPGWVKGSHLRLWLHGQQLDTLSASGLHQPNWMQALALSNVRVATAFLTFGLLTELAALVMWWRPARRWVMLALACMHIGISFVMNIHFVPSVLILLALGLPLAELVDRLRAGTRAPAAPGSAKTA